MDRRRCLGLWAGGACLASLGLSGRALAAPAAACPSLLQHTVARLQDERPVDLCTYAGKVLLVVNTASKCGFTPQYESLEKLHDRYRERGLVVLGFPSNEFGQQEPGSNAEIAAFCENTFGVRFPMFAKTNVKPGPAASPLFAQLAQRSGKAPGWNFHKYLIARDGQRVASYPSEVDPQDRAFIRDIERLLGDK